MSPVYRWCPIRQAHIPIDRTAQLRDPRIFPPAGPAKTPGEIARAILARHGALR